MLHLWLSYQMDRFGDVMDVEGAGVSRQSVRRWNCLVTSLVKIACSACRTNVHSVRAIIDCTIQIPIPCRGGLPRPPVVTMTKNQNGKAQRPAPMRSYQTKSINPASPRSDAGWDVEREGRETKVLAPTGELKVCTGDFGTSARHPPRERIDCYAPNPPARPATSVSPYTEFLSSHRVVARKNTK